MSSTYDLTTLEEVRNRIEDDVNSDMERVIIAKILDASDTARFLGAASWMSDTVPPSVSRIVASAVARYMSNPSGYAQSRAADETLVWQDADIPGAVTFTETETLQIKSAAEGAKAPTFGSFSMAAGVPVRRRNMHVYDRDGEDGYVLSAPYGMPFPAGL